MPVGYDTESFFAITLSLNLETWKWALPRALLLTPVSIVLALLDDRGHLDFLDDRGITLATNVTGPFVVLLGLILSFRLGDAFRKWERAGQLVLSLHSEARTAVMQLCNYLPKGKPDVDFRMQEIRRYLVLGCVLLKAHVRDEDKGVLEECKACGLLDDADLESLRRIATVADGPTGDGKQDKFPTRGRPAFAFSRASAINHSLLVDGHYRIPHTFVRVETSLEAMANQFEAAEHLATSIVPLPYAQLMRVITLVYLMLLPVSVVQTLGWATIPLCFTANIVYFLADSCASEMELPLGSDPNDVDVEKTLRRIDKLTSALLADFLGHPVTNYNLFPSSRTTNADGTVTRRSRTLGHNKMSIERTERKREEKQQQKRKGRQDPPALVSVTSSGDGESPPRNSSYT